MHVQGTINKKNGFTLIEIIITISLLSILAHIAIPRFIAFYEYAKLSNDKEAAALVANAAAIYVAEHQGDPTWTFDISETGLQIDKLLDSKLILTSDLNLVSNGYGGGTITDANLGINGSGQVTITLIGVSPISNYIISK